MLKGIITTMVKANMVANMTLMGTIHMDTLITMGMVKDMAMAMDMVTIVDIMITMVDTMEIMVDMIIQEVMTIVVAGIIIIINI